MSTFVTLLIITVYLAFTQFLGMVILETFKKKIAKWRKNAEEKAKRQAELAEKTSEKSVDDKDKEIERLKNQLKMQSQDPTMESIAV